MKTIWLILIGMVLFNGFLLTFNGFFRQSPYSSGEFNITDVSNNANLSQYKTPGQIGINWITSAVLSGGVSIFAFITGAVLTMASKNFQYLAAAALVSLVSGVWISTATIFAQLMNGNVVLMGIYSLVSIAIGIIVAVLVIGIFTGQDQLGY